MQAQDINIEQLVESELNPRGSYDEASLAELAESLKSVGLLQPLTVRPVRGRSKKSKYEVVCGHRRLRAARLAGLTELACLVRELDDREAAFVALVENSQRQDVSPLDEAAAMRRLIDGGVGVEEIAARLARPVRFVQHRLQLTNLIESVQALVRAGRLPLAGAVRVAALAEDMQLDVPEAVENHIRSYGGISVAQVYGIIERVSRSLAKVPWDLTDPDLTDAGACSTCPLRTGAQADLIDAGSTDRCLARACFDQKKAAWLEREKSAGVEVREGYVATKAIAADYVYVSDPEDGRSMPWRDETGTVPKVIYQSPDGRLTEAYDRDVLASALREAGFEADADALQNRSPAATSDKEAAKLNRKRAEAFNLAIGGLLEESDLKLRVQEWGTEAMILCEIIPALVLMAIKACNSDPLKAVCSRREVKPVKDAYGRPDLAKPLRDYAQSLPVTDQWLLFLELLAMAGGTYAPAYHGDAWPESWRTLREVVYGPTPATPAPNADVNADGEVIDEADQG